MGIDIEILTSESEQVYERMLQEREDTLLYTSLKYRNLLRQHVEARDYYLIARRENKVVGALPLFLKKNPEYGNVLNSLPFYGSNGGVIISPSEPDPDSIFKALADSLHSLAREKEVVITTIITSPFEQHAQLYEQELAPSFLDSRIGQISNLPSSSESSEDAVMDMIDSNTRNMVRKARKKDIAFTHSSDIEALRFLSDTHQKNMEAVGGIAKGWGFFRKVPEIFDYDTDYRVYLATLDGQPISGLLTFYYDKTVEYYTPAIVQEFRSLQSNSLLIFEAMKDAVRQGYRYWNFGGTWHSQDGVYRFKKKWGTQDMPYYYYVIAFQDLGHLLEMKPQEIIAEYPYFYVLPFDVLRNS